MPSNSTFVEGQGWLVEERQIDRVTAEGGSGRRLTNKTGAASVRGTIVKLDSVVDKAFIVAPADDEAPAMVVYDDGVLDGEECFVVSEGYTPVLLKDGTASVAGNWSIVSDAAGRADATSASPIPLDHWKEIGHCCETKEAGVDVLALHKLHFN